MSTRQNKKQRKGRNNANNRERTVTTLTGDPNTPYLNPPANEKAAMPTSFSGSPAGGAGGKVHNMPMGQQHYQMQNNFGYAYNQPFMPNMQQQFQPQQQQSQPYSPPLPSRQPHSQVPLPPGKNDLEILQNLKKMILDNEHPFYKAIPSPQYLASLWKGPVSTQSGGRGSEQPVSDSHTPASSSTAFNGDRRQPHHQTGDRRLSVNEIQQNNSGTGNRFNAAPAGNAVSNPNGEDLNMKKDSHTPSSGGPSLVSRLSDAPAPSIGSGALQNVSDGQRQGRYDYPARSRSRDDYTSVNARPGAPGYDNAAMDVSVDDKASMYGVKGEMSRPGGWVPRDAALPRADGGYDSDHAYSHRPQAQTVRGSTDDSRPQGAPVRASGPTIDDRGRDRSHKEGWFEPAPRPDYDRDTKLVQGGTSSQYGSAPARSTPAEAPAARMETRRPSVISSAGEIRPPVDPRPPLDTRADFHAVPPRAAEGAVADNNEDIGSSRSSSVRPPDVAAPAPPALVPAPSSAVPADKLVPEPPSLKDRIHPPVSHPPSRNVSEPPVPPAEQRQHAQQPSPAMHNRSNKPPKFQKDRAPASYGGAPPPHESPHRGGDRGYHRPPTPPGPPAVSSGGPPAPPPPHRAYDSRSASVDRPRVPPAGLPPSRNPPPPPPREYRGPPGRDLSRPVGQSYRPDYHDDPRYDPRYDGRSYRDYSPPPAPLPLTSARGGVEPPPSSRADYYPPRGRGWEEDDYYKNRGWDGPPPPPVGERGRYERDYPPPRSAGWDREYDPRDAYVSGPPGPPYDDRYVPGPPADRGRPPPGGYGAPYNRVRPRSPSPLRRGPGPIDDSRPPMKRPREDYPPDYYAPGSGGRRPSDYPGPPPRSGSTGPPPSSSGWSSLPPPPPPTSGSSAASVGIGPPHSHPPPGDRDYRMGREPPVDYGPPPGGYDRPRSPGPPGPPGSGGRMPYRGGGGGYGRGGEPRDRNGYGMSRP